MIEKEHLALLISEGEGYKVEFKESLSKGFERELVAFSNASGGSIWIGISDNGEIVGTKNTNHLKSQLYDIARNCDPSISIRIVNHLDHLIEVIVEEGQNKPYQCKDGFFLRNGPSSQKLKRNEIIDLINQSGNQYFDESIDINFQFPQDFSAENYFSFLKAAQINTTAEVQDVLSNLNVIQQKNDQIYMTRAGILCFANQPDQFIKESYITCIRYQGEDRVHIVDKKDYKGSVLSQIEAACLFFKQHISQSYIIENNAQRRDVLAYPFAAYREAVINAVVHRDYFYDHSHIFVHIFSNKIEIENPGGLFRGLSIGDLGKRSVRRNRLLADLLHRAKYIEGVGSGIERMKSALKKNGNPPFEVTSSNFFVISFRPIQFSLGQPLSYRQSQIVSALRQHGELSKQDVANIIGASGDTALRELTGLLKKGIIFKNGEGKATRYWLSKDR